MYLQIEHGKQPKGLTHLLTLLPNIMKTHKKDGNISITPQLASDQEIDYEINQLIKESETIRKKSKS